MYDFAHSLSDYIEHISHSLCSLEFEDHRPLYDWFIKNCEGAVKGLPEIPPKQYEFSRLNIERFVMSKRWLKKFVDEGLVDGWDDQRMPTISGLRRRGYPAGAIREFTVSTGITKNVMTVPISALEYYVRTHLDPVAVRAAAVENPIKVIITNYPANKTEKFAVANNPKNGASGTHEIDFSHEIYIDGDDFSDNPPPKYKRLVVGGTVQLRGAYKIKCIQNHGPYLECEITEEKAAGVIQFVNCSTAVKAKIHEFSPLLKNGTDICEENINRNSCYEHF
jgi:glutaminyl-tRNA synthetase